jgi:hypothetical protein
MKFILVIILTMGASGEEPKTIEMRITDHFRSGEH